MLKKMNRRKKTVLFVLVVSLSIAYTYSILQFPQRFNIIIKNNTNSSVKQMLFKTDLDNSEGLAIIDIAPYETVKVSREFNKVTEKFIAVIDFINQEEKVIPLAYIYSPNAKNIVIINIDNVQDNKVSKLTLKSFENYFSIIPWWIRAFYDYNTEVYDFTSDNLHENNRN